MHVLSNLDIEEGVIIATRCIGRVERPIRFIARLPPWFCWLVCIIPFDK